METATINFWAVLVSAVAYMALGAIWYSPALFGNAWMKGIGKTKEQITADFSPVSYFVAFATSFLAAYGIARIMLWMGGESIYDGVIVALLAGVCFVLTSLGVTDAFEKRPRSLSFINIFFHIVGFVIAGIIIGAWR
ncbi:MAG: DUF1761 domain-containing protein [Candidatus Zixiibacteriota bacterium]